MEETHLISAGLQSVRVIYGTKGLDSFTSLLDILRLFDGPAPESLRIDLSSFEPRLGLVQTLQLAVSYSAELFAKLERNVEGILDRDPAVIQDLVLQLVRTCLGTKVTADIRFGEALEPMVGNDTALGMVKEAEVARHLGYCSQATVSRLTQCLASFGFETRLKDSLSAAPEGTTRMFILEEIGSSHRFMAVSNQFVHLALQKEVTVIPSGPIHGTVTVPGSKSISNRVLLLAALGKGTCELRGLLDSDDTRVMLGALERFGAGFQWMGSSVLAVTGTGGLFQECSGEIYLGNAGTASRFLTTTATFIRSGPTPLILTGNARMKERPIGPLVTALRANGCSIDYVEADGCLPLRVKHTGLRGGLLELQGKVSSQYVSSVLMGAPYAYQPLTLQLAEANPTSLPYITMTLDLMRDFGVGVTVEGTNRFVIPTGTYINPATWTVEPDASSATYFLAMAAITGGYVRVNNMGSRSLQGDAGFYRVLKAMGCTVEQTEESTTVQGPSSQLRSFSLNMETMTDAFMTAAVLAAVANGKSHITGIANQRVKECNRILVMVTELGKLGITCGELEDGIWIQGVTDLGQLNRPVSISCHDDHRIAMSFAVLGCLLPGIIITDKECTGKTFPGFWDEARLQLNLTLNSRPEAAGTVFLIGMRGCGKSTLGKLGAAALGLGFVNMDEVLERQLNQSIKDYVAVNGWAEFRKAEQELLLNLVDNPRPGTIVSCGGGIVESETNQRALSSQSDYVINIQRDSEEIFTLLRKDKSRPDLLETVPEVWTKREPLYQKCSGHKFLVESDWEGVNARFIDLVQRIITS